MAGSLQGFIQLENVIDVEAERTRLEKSLQTASLDLAETRGKLANSSFLEKAPAAVVNKERAKGAELSALVEKLEVQLAELSPEMRS